MITLLILLLILALAVLICGLIAILGPIIIIPMILIGIDVFFLKHLFRKRG